MPNERLAALIFRLGRDNLPTGVIEEQVRVVEAAHPLASMEKRLNFALPIFAVAMKRVDSTREALLEVLTAVAAMEAEHVIYEPDAEHLGEWARALAVRLTGQP